MCLIPYSDIFNGVTVSERVQPVWIPKFYLYILALTLPLMCFRDPTVFADIYIKPYARAAPYIIGIVLAYILFKKVKLRNVSIITSAFPIPVSDWFIRCRSD